MPKYYNTIPFLKLPSLPVRREFKFYVFNICACVFLTSVTYASPEKVLSHIEPVIDLPVAPEQIKSIETSAQQGDVQAQCQLAICYGKGTGVRQDYQKAFQWAWKAAQQNSAEGQYLVAACYYQGKGVKLDLKEAFKWFSKSAHNGIYGRSKQPGNHV